VALWEDYRRKHIRGSRAGFFTCPHCGAVYELTYTRLVATDHDRAICAKCRQVMKEWNDDFSR
jgi:transcription elongation factor Elf1